LGSEPVVSAGSGGEDENGNDARRGCEAVADAEEP
jgi:hypothetical protein